MKSHEWNSILGRIPSSLKTLRRGADESSLERVEQAFKAPLPESFRAFLSLHDGGSIGPLEIFGTAQLLGAHTGTIPWSLIPFHPVGDSGDVECFDTSRPDRGEFPVVWFSPGSHRGPGSKGAFEPGADATTYMDFNDWLLDHLLDIHQSMACRP